MIVLLGGAALAQEALLVEVTTGADVRCAVAAGAPVVPRPTVTLLPGERITVACVAEGAEPAPAPDEGAKGVVAVEGGVWVQLVRDDGGVYTAGLVPPGSYTIRARFDPERPGSLSSAGTVLVEPGEAVTVRCSKQLRVCERVR